MQTTSYGVIIGVDERRSGVRIKGRRRKLLLCSGPLGVIDYYLSLQTSQPDTGH